MKLYFRFLNVIIVYFGKEVASQAEVHLSAVTSFEGLDQLYVKLHTDWRIKLSTDLDLSSKSAICDSIFSKSDYFSAVELLNPSEKGVKKHLREKRKDIFCDIFVRKRRNCIKKRYKYANKSVERELFIGSERYREKVFTCVGRKGSSSTAEIVQYLVSLDTFNVNEAPAERPIAGRFIFLYTSGTGSVHLSGMDSIESAVPPRQMIIHAFAEEPGRTYTDSTYYELKKVLYTRTQRKEDDPLCKLSQSDIIRLCTSDLTGLRIWNKRDVKFTPNECNVSLSCELRIVLSGNKQHEEWTRRCHARSDGNPTTFHLSQGYGVNEIMAFEERNSQLYVHHYSHRIGVMEEKPADFGPEDGDTNIWRASNNVRNIKGEDNFFDK